MQINWPPVPGKSALPIWNGKAFEIGSEQSKILCYHDAESGWNHSLTLMHEEAAGDNHFIDGASRRSAIAALGPVLEERQAVILEVGCSSGFLLEALRAEAPQAVLVGSDFLTAPLRRLADRLPGIPIVQFDLTRCPLEDASVDAAVALNVLEHIENDREALRQLHRILKPGGRAVVEVPAGPHLYDFYDKHLMHYRRYRLEDITSLAEDTGFAVERASHLGFFLYPLFVMVKKRNQRRGVDLPEVERQALVANQIGRARTSPLLAAVMRLELALGRYVRYPVGIRCLVTLRKMPLRPAAA